MRRLFLMAFVIGAAWPLLSARPSAQAGAAAAAGPLMAIETAKGAIEIRLFRADAPKSVDHILELAKANFYRGQRIHRVERTLVQFGDPQSRDVSKRDYWGTSGSGRPIGTSEVSKKHLHTRGAVGLAHGGNAQLADSQIYILKAASPNLDGVHVVIGQVTKGMEVVDKLAVSDVIKLVTVK